MMTSAPDSPLAARYVSDLTFGVKALAHRRKAQERSALKAAVRNAVRGVLTYSDDPAALMLAVRTLHDLETRRHHERIAKDAETLRAYGAHITPAAVNSAATELGLVSAGRQLDELERERARVPQHANPIPR